MGLLLFVKVGLGEDAEERGIEDLKDGR